MSDDIRWAFDLTDKWHVVPTRQEMTDLFENRNPFMMGKILFTTLAFSPKDGSLNFDWDVLPIPRGIEKQATVHELIPVGILKKSAHKEEAFLFIIFFYELEMQKWAIDTGYTPLVKSAELYQYIDESEAWVGKNTEAVKQTIEMCCRLPQKMKSTFYTGKYWGVLNTIPAMIQQGADYVEIQSVIDGWSNEKAEFGPIE